MSQMYLMIRIVSVFLLAWIYTAKVAEFVFNLSGGSLSTAQFFCAAGSVIVTAAVFFEE